MKDKLNTKLMFDAMTIENNRFWPTLTSIDEKVNMNMILPATILNFSEYTAKLQALAMYAESGNNKAMQAVLDNTECIEKKNYFLQPLFRDLKSQIRHMTFTPEYEIMREYLGKRAELQKAILGTMS